MLFNIVKRSFFNQKKALLLMVLSISVGTAIVASLFTLSFEINSKLSKELRSFGANILIEPRVDGLADLSGQKRYLYEEDMIKAKTIFWRHNIIGLSPFLESRGVIDINGRKEKIDMVGAWYEKEIPLPGERGFFNIGIKTVFLWWHLDGKWPSDNEVVVGSAIAKKKGFKIGDKLTINDRVFTITGILDSGGRADNFLHFSMPTLQEMVGLQGKISKVYVSALTTPMDEFAYKDPKTMTRTEYEKWYCTGYVTSIAKQLEEVFKGSRAKPIWQVAEAEGNILKRLNLLIYLLSSVALIASSLSVSTTMIMSLLRRIEEIGLMKALGADKVRIITIFFTEGTIIGLIGGLVGYSLSLFVSKYIGVQVFETGLEQKTILLPLSLGSSLIIALGATFLPLNRALKIKSAVVLKGIR
jgi:putative ABC transport system permease protein